MKTLRCKSKPKKGWIGESSSAKKLEEIIDQADDRRLVNKVGKIISFYKQELNHLSDIKDLGFRYTLATARRHYYEERIISSLSSYSPEVRSFLRNVIAGIYRDYVKEFHSKLNSKRVT